MSETREIAPRKGFAGKWLGAALLLGVCAFTCRAEETGAAKVVTLNGQVSILRDNSPWAVNVGDSVQPRQIIVTGVDGYALLQVSDGSTFEVFPNSRVVFRDNPGNWKDLLEVFLGRVKIQIQKIGGQPNYNKVRTPTAVISVRGTVFDVSVEDEDATTLVVVDEGQVEVRHALLPSGTKMLNAGEWIRVYKTQPLQAKSVDHGGVIRGAMRAAADALYEVMYRTSRIPSSSGGGVPVGGGGGGGGGGTGGGSGGGNGNKPPAPAPPPPPPPPPSH
ncbi:MAG TPA: FecR domain-containing protein [Bryobacteraceae bacterium]|nr:FecR domain-containing protein [Bryobacteraceae bacterium]